MEKLERAINEYIEKIDSKPFADQEELNLFEQYAPYIESDQIYFITNDSELFTLCVRAGGNKDTFEQTQKKISDNINKLLPELDIALKKDSLITQKKYLSKKFPELNDMTDIIIDAIHYAVYKQDIKENFKIVDFGSSLKKRLNYLRKSENEFVNNKTRTIIKIFSIIKTIDPNNKDKLYNFKFNIFDGINDDKVIYELLKVFTMCNTSTYINIKTQNTNLLENSMYALDRIFLEYKINYNDYNKSQKSLLEKYGDINNIKEILSIIPGTFIQNIIISDFGINLLLNSKKENVSNVLRFINTGFIDVTFAMEHPEIFSSRVVYGKKLSPMYETFIQNMGLLNNNFNYKKDILLSDSNDVRKMIEIASIYNLHYISKNMLENASLIDNLIELDMYEYLIEHSDILDLLDINLIKRIKLAQMLDYDIYNNNNNLKQALLTGHKFYLADQDLDTCIINKAEYYKNITNNNYIINEEVFTNSVISKLEVDYKLNDLIYEIDGVLLSRIKILTLASANLNDLDNVIFNILINNSILDDNEITLIEENLFAKKQSLKKVPF